MSLTNPNTPVSQQDLQDFYHKLLPYMGGSSGGSGGGHTIEDSEGTDLMQRDTLQFGEGFLAEDDDTNEKTVISPDIMQSGDMSDVITPLPSVGNKLPVLFDESGAERVVGWYKYANGTKKPVYEKEINKTSGFVSGVCTISHGIQNIDEIIGYRKNWITKNTSAYMSIPFVNDTIAGSILDNGITKTNADIWCGSTEVANNIALYKVIITYTKTTDTPNT